MVVPAHHWALWNSDNFLSFVTSQIDPGLIPCSATKGKCLVIVAAMFAFTFVAQNCSME